MILKALLDLYEILVKRGDVPRMGWSSELISYRAHLDRDGKLTLIEVLEKGASDTRGLMTAVVPYHAKRSNQILPFFLVETPNYVFGIEKKGVTARSRNCFEAFRAYNCALLKDAACPEAKAFVRFLESWDPDSAEKDPVVGVCRKALLAGGNIMFLLDGRPIHECPEIEEIWHREVNRDEGDEAVCLVTGTRAPVVRVHPGIRHMRGGQQSGSSLVSFNSESSCKRGKTGGDNAPVSRYAAIGYSTALNHLLYDREHSITSDEQTILCWAASGDVGYQSVLLSALMGSGKDSETKDRVSDQVMDSMRKLSSGMPAEVGEIELQPGMEFFILGASPYYGRIIVRFFERNSFAHYAVNVARHWKRMEMEDGHGNLMPVINIYRMAREAVSQSETDFVRNRLAQSIVSAVIDDGKYPADLMTGVLERIRKTQKIWAEQAAILKACLIRNGGTGLERPEEVFKVNLNEECTYVPYTLGRLMAVMQRIQLKADSDVSRTLTEIYLASASTRPADVFPKMMQDTFIRLCKIGPEGMKIYLKNMFEDLIWNLDETMPGHLKPHEQAAFMIGYFQQDRSFYRKKEENNE